jgi:radical SAM superfamily enzyme YgiQ (UPF0313 family)
MNKEYHAVFLGGNKSLVGGRIIAGYRLRTALLQYGYEMLVLDSAVSMTGSELMSLLKNVVTDKTCVLGVSTVWLDSFFSTIDWINDDFFKSIKEQFPKLLIVAGGPESSWVPGATIIYNNSDWVLNGFSDEAFPKLLEYLHGKDSNLKYIKDHNGKKNIHSNKFYQISKPDDIETIFYKEDGFLPCQPIPLEISRGCIFRCSFCTHPFQGAKDYDSYIRTPESIARELKRNYELFGTTRYSIMDDTFNDSIEKLERLERAIDIAKLPSFEFQSYIKPELLVTKPAMIKKLANLGLRAGFVGIESMNNLSRKSMHKGMDIDRVCDAIRELNTISKSKMHASFITGLPHDTVDDIVKSKEFLLKNIDNLFRSWKFRPLIMYYNRELQGLSEIDKNPEKFGYTIVKKNPGSFAIWENKNMTFYQAKELSEKINKESLPFMKVSGWLVPLAWHLDIPDSIVETSLLTDLDLLKLGKENNRERAIQILKCNKLI